MSTESEILSVKMLDLELASATFMPNPHADFITIYNKNGGEITITGVDFWEYVGTCIKRTEIDSTVAWMEEQPTNSYIPRTFRKDNLDY